MHHFGISAPPFNHKLSVHTCSTGNKNDLSDECSILHFKGYKHQLQQKHIRVSEEALVRKLHIRYDIWHKSIYSFISNQKQFKCKKKMIYKLSAIPILTIHVKSEGPVVPGLLYMKRWTSTNYALYLKWHLQGLKYLLNAKPNNSQMMVFV